ncbi:MAG: hypothetical protein QXF07_00010 [Candidatus Micrarchaeia archaeon]
MNPNIKIAALAIFVLIFGAIFMSGCTGQTETKQNFQEVNKTLNQTEQTKDTTKPLSSLSDIFAKTSAIKSVKYDMLMTGLGSSVTQTVWLKGNKMKSEISAEGEKIINIVDLDKKVMYSYMPAQGIAFRTNFDYSYQYVSPTESIEKYNPVVLGNEIIDGKDCVIVQYSMEGMQIKSWIWKEKGFPIRVETTSGEGKTIIEYKNIEFIEIPDSEFELPSGVQILG